MTIKHTLSSLLAGLVPAEVLRKNPLADKEVTFIANNSAQLTPECFMGKRNDIVFFAEQGLHSHGLSHITVKQAAKFLAVGYQRPAFANDINKNNEVIIEQNKQLNELLDVKFAEVIKAVPEKMLEIDALNEKMSLIAARFYDFPSQRLPVIGVTGTNGKTSIVNFIAQLADFGMVGTMGYGYYQGNDLVLEKLSHTTPDALSLQKILNDLIINPTKAISGIAMEVSSHALALDRVTAVDYPVAVFTNLTQDHLDFHPSMDAYLEEKSKLFTRKNLQHAIINVDDKYSKALIDIMKKSGSTANIWAYGQSAQVKKFDNYAYISNIALSDSGISFDVELKNNCDSNILPLSKYKINTKLWGEFNVYNAVAAALSTIVLGFEPFTIFNRLNNLIGVKGRIDVIALANNINAVVDYAHTPDALKSVLSALRKQVSQVANNGSGNGNSENNARLICVFGCGGDRDKTKRPLMAEIASDLADLVVVTDDNPRTEKSEAIIKDIIAGNIDKAKVKIASNRAEAITYALDLAQPNDVVLIAGKGHEEYQIIGNQTIDFSDFKVVKDWQEKSAHLGILPKTSSTKKIANKDAVSAKDAMEQASLAEFGLTISRIAEILSLSILKAESGKDLASDSNSDLSSYLATPITRICTDSRTLMPGDLFIALVGENFDGHDFVKTAQENGAVACIVSKIVADVDKNNKSAKKSSKSTIKATGKSVSKSMTNADMRQLLVDDTLIALGKIAAYMRSQLTGKVIALTGSVGKTTNKQMLKSILAVSHNVCATKGNLNNEIGVPLTLLNAKKDADFHVIELGASHSGDIAYLTNIVKPNLAMITNVGPVHLEGFGSIAGVAKAKAEIFAGLVPFNNQPPIAIINSDDKYHADWLALNKKNEVYQFSYDNDLVDGYAENINENFDKFTLVLPTGKIDINLNVAGKHHISNAVGCAISCFALGISIYDIKFGLENFESEKGRFIVHKFNAKELKSATKSESKSALITLIDDSYNANSLSIAASVDAIANCAADRLVILGDMAELGEFSSAIHVALAKSIKDKAEQFLCFGDAMLEFSRAVNDDDLKNSRHEQYKAQHFPDIKYLNMALLSIVKQYIVNQQDLVILVKGSRSMRMERVVEFMHAALLHECNQKLLPKN